MSVIILSWFRSSIPSIICRFPLLVISKALFSMPNSKPISALYIRIACFRVSNYFFIFGKQIDVVHVHNVIDFHAIVH